MVDPAISDAISTPSATASQAPESPNNIRGTVNPKLPHFRGPTSSAFSFDVAKSSLKKMGITGEDETVDDPLAMRHTPPAVSPRITKELHPSKDALWAMSKTDALRLLGVFEDEMGIMYPFLDMAKLARHVNLLFTFMEAALRTGFAQFDLPGADEVRDDDTNILKAVLAAALMVEGSGQSDLGTRLFENVKNAAEQKIWDLGVTLKGLELLTILAMYHFMRDEESLSWRLIGLAGRMCLELGLHRHEILETYDEGDRERVTRLFWSIFCLDRRWSFGTGMPFALQDADIDPLLPKPGTSTPYLSAMVAYGRISSKVWRTIASFEDPQGEPESDQISYLDHQTSEWYKTVTPELQLFGPDKNAEVGVRAESRAIYRLRVILYLRHNQMRILIYRPVLHSATRIMEQRNDAFTVVDVAKDTIRLLSHLHASSDIYRTQQVCFNYFLVSALAVLFLAVSHAPAQFSMLCRDEFYQALDLVKGFSSKSYISKRLWKTIRGLKDVGPKLGLTSRDSSGQGSARGLGSMSDIRRESSADAHSTAAVAMAGLAGQAVNGSLNDNQGPHTPNFHPSYRTQSYVQPQRMVSIQTDQSPLDGFQLSNELTFLFEAAGGFSHEVNNNEDRGHRVISEGLAGQPSMLTSGQDMQPGLAQISGVISDDARGEDELSKIMRDLF
ncbi:MAG: hypothetical protein M1825_003008 [Sarcosagium campestre]|nr:MAG: hypothetical protein M1825_003008 [Sarcosagium campestre]